jgi:hypothetical protein
MSKAIALISWRASSRLSALSLRTLLAKNKKCGSILASSTSKEGTDGVLELEIADIV